MNICIIGLSKSTNLGDVLISECLEKLIDQQYPNNNISHLDLFGRRRPKGRNIILRQMLSPIVNLIPKKFQYYLIIIPLKVQFYFFIRRRILRSIKDNDFFIIGGGQLFREKGFRLPFVFKKLYKYIDISQKYYSIFSVGCSADWKTKKSQAFYDLINCSNNIYTSVRDNISFEYLRSLDIQKEVNIAPDPVFTYPFINETKVYDIGIFLTSPLTLTIYADDLCVKSIKEYRFIIENFLLNLVHLNKRIILLNNGNPEDFQFNKSIYKKIIKKVEHSNILFISERLNSTDKYVKTIASCKTILSMRMHPLILAYTQKNPTYIIAWDRKLRGFSHYTMQKIFSIKNEAKQEELLTTIKRDNHNGFKMK